MTLCNNLPPIDINRSNIQSFRPQHYDFHSSFVLLRSLFFRRSCVLSCPCFRQGVILNRSSFLYRKYSVLKFRTGRLIRVLIYVVILFIRIQLRLLLTLWLVECTFGGVDLSTPWHQQKMQLRWPQL